MCYLTNEKQRSSCYLKLHNFACDAHVDVYRHIQSVNEMVCMPRILAAALLQNFHKVSVLLLLVL